MPHRRLVIATTLGPSDDRGLKSYRVQKFFFNSSRLYFDFFSFFPLKKLPPFTLARFDLTTRSFNLLGPVFRLYFREKNLVCVFIWEDHF
jgi:hypothetical protein